MVLESDGAGVQGLDLGGGHGIFTQNFPFVSTDRARLALQVRNNSNDVKWFFADGYFSIRHDQRLGFEPPAVDLQSPVGGESFPGGSIVPITWTATASEGLRSFDIQGSYDSGRTWHLIVRDLSSAAVSYDWQLPPSSGIADVRVRVVARDGHFQNSSSTSGPFSMTPWGDSNADGYTNGNSYTFGYSYTFGDADAYSYTFSDTNCNCAPESHSERYSHTEGSPNAAPAAVMEIVIGCSREALTPARAHCNAVTPATAGKLCFGYDAIDR